ncbi:MAG: uroporphyrinogen decarboxylase family protein [Armatimonadota bacterium]|jgi:uroporphyrinogen decarboxylase
MAYRSRDRVARILAHEAADRVPYDAARSRELVALVDSMDLPPDHRELCLEGDFARVTFDPESGGREAFEPFFPGLPAAAEMSCWGFGRVPLKSVEGHHAGHKYFHPLAALDSAEDLERFPFPDFADGDAPADLAQDVEAAKSRGFTVMGAMSQTILETAYCMRGLEQLMADFHERPDYVAALFEQLGQRRRHQARAFAEAGVDILRIGDDIATQEALMVGLGLYRETIKPHHAAAIAAARETDPDIHVLYHSDGNLTELLPDLIEIGVTAINPVQPECMDLAQIKREFGGDLTLWGCCPVQSLFEHGSGEDVLDYVRFLMREIAPGGGLVLQFINMIITPRVLDNLRVFFGAFYEMGKYA